MGVLMLLYSIGEIVFSLKAKSLTMFSDGLHNLSDALALAVALWAERVQHKVGCRCLIAGTCSSSSPFCFPAPHKEQTNFALPPICF